MLFGNLGFLSGLSFRNMKLTSVEIEKKLDDPNSTLEDLLVEEELIQELKNQNQKLLKFLSKDKIKSLINYIIKEPTEDDQLKGHKFPFVASELLNCDIDNISDLFLMTNPELKQKKEKEKMNNEKNTSKDYLSKDINDILSELNKEKNEEEEKKENENKNEEKENKVKEEESKEDDYPSNRIELLDYLLSFVQTDSELNYVLAGYFSKFLTILFNNKPVTLINYFYNERKDILEKFIYHSYRKSISDLLSKFLLFNNFFIQKDSLEPYSSDIVNDDKIKELSNIRNELIEKIFSHLKINEEREKISSIVKMLIEIFETKSLLNEIMENGRFFTTLFSNLKVDLNSEENINNLKVKGNYSEILELLTYMISNSQNIKKPKLDSNDNQTIIHTNLSENIFNFFDNFIENFNQKEETKLKINSIPTVFNESQIKPLGLFRVKIIDFFTSLFPYFIDISIKYDQLLIKSNFFPIAFKYLFEYEWNNFYQLSLLSLFKNYLKDANYHIELSQYLFENIQIINIIKNYILQNEEKKFKFSSENTISHGYIPFLISLSYKINSVIGGTPLLLFTRSREGSISFVNKTEGNDLFNRYKIGLGFGNELLTNENKERKSTSSKNNICESMQKYVNDDWNDFFKNNVSEVVRLYETKLCDKNNLQEEDDFYDKEKEDDKNDKNLNPFNKDDNFFDDDNNKNNNNDDNWFNNDKDNNQNTNSVNIYDFEFVDEVKSSEKVEDIQNSTGNLLVDELDNDQYNDANFYKVPLNNNNYLEEALKELDI